MYHSNPAWIDHDGSGRPLMSDYALDRTAEAVAALTFNAKVVGDLCPNDEESAAIAAALAKEDSTALLSVYRAAMDRHVQELIDDWQDRSGNDSDYEAAMALGRTYE